MRIFFQLTKEEQEYVGTLKAFCTKHGINGAVNLEQPMNALDLTMLAKSKNCDKIVTTNQHMLSSLLEQTGAKLGRTRPSIDDYAGSIIEYRGFEILIVPPILHIYSVPYGKFLWDRYITKFTKPSNWLDIPEFSWKLFEPKDAEHWINTAASATMMSVDIETIKSEDRDISCVGMSFIFMDRATKSYDIQTLVIPFDDPFNVAVIQIILENSTPKILQNGKYDAIYLLRFNCPIHMWIADTMTAFHSWYCELPKDLGFITSFVIRKWIFWKNESQTSDKHTYYMYNAKDCFTTAISWLALVKEMPDWAWQNYYQEFPLLFPCLVAELGGLRRDEKAAEIELERFEKSLERQLLELRKMTGALAFNPSSPAQVLKLFHVYGSKDLTDTTPASFDRFKFRHPLNQRIGDAIIKYRKDRKLVTSYLRDENAKTKDKKTWLGKIFYSLNPHGTDTGRLASKESAFWCGWQIQNIPRARSDINIKNTIIAEEDFLFGEADYEQAEARDTAYLSGDVNLIAAVDDETRDFHGHNASAFFGIPYEKIVQSTFVEEVQKWVHKTLDKGLRDTSKRTNHGANYNMQAQTLLDTMGIAAVLLAKKLLNFPANWTPIQVTTQLLLIFDKTYPIVRGDYYRKIISDIKNTQKLVGPTGWTRYCFMNPEKSKQAMNAYAAHPSQSLNAMTLNKAWMNIYRNVWIPHYKIFRLNAQIHDSILFQYHKHEPWLVEEVERNMIIPIPVKDTFGITRTLTVPVSVKSGATRWGDLS